MNSFSLQCLDNNPEDLVQMIETGIANGGAPVPSAADAASVSRFDSIDHNWMMSGDSRMNNDGGSSFSSRASSVVAAPQQSQPPLVTAETDRALLFDKPRRQYENSDSLVEKFTILLNFCIEDIEAFCGDVRAMKQEDGGRTLDDLQAVDFTKIFQKFKLAFNFLVSAVQKETNISCTCRLSK